MGIGRHALAGVIAATFATAACSAASGADRVTLELAAPLAASQSASVASLLPRVDTGSSNLTVAVHGAIDATRQQQDRTAAAVKKTAEEKAAEEKTQVRKKSSGGCAQQAMAARQFDPSCSAYQGYLDPGTSAGRAPTSGEIQMQFACQQGLVPKSDC